MHSRLAALLNGAKSLVLLEHRVPIYEERGEVYKHNAYMTALRKTQIDLSSSFDSVGPISDSVTLRFYEGRKIEIVRNEEGAHFAKSPSGEFYAVDLPLFLSGEYVRKGEYYKKLSRSVIRRYLREPIELMYLGGIEYSLDRIMMSLEEIGYTFHRMERMLGDISSTVHSLADRTNDISGRLTDSPETMNALSPPGDSVEVIVDSAKFLPSSSAEETD